MEREFPRRARERSLRRDRTRPAGPSHGFTLIELLVVIAIIALLVSILVPTLQKAKELARDIKCMSNLHHVAGALKLYVADFDGQFPYWGDYIDSEGARRGTNWWARIGIVSEGERNSSSFNRNRNVYPEEEKIWREGYIEWKFSNFEEGVFKCPTANVQIEPKSLSKGRWTAHYGMNDFLTPGELKTCYKEEDFDPGLVLVCDSHLGWYGSANSGRGGYYMWGGLHLNPYWHGYDPWPQQLNPGGMSGSFPGHSGNTTNTARIDGSVAAEELLTWEDFMER